MTCHEFESVVVDLARRELNDSKLGTVCWAHAANCPRCAERLLHEEKLTAGFEALATGDNDHPSNPNFEAALRMEFRKQSTQPATKAERRPAVFQMPASVPLIRFSWAWAAIAAAVLAPLMVILAERWQAPQPATPVAESSKHPQGPSVSNNNTGKNSTGVSKSSQKQNAGGVQKLSSGKTHRPANGKKKNAPKLPTDWANPNDEVVGNFIPLPYGSGLGLDDGWQVVRVTLPRSDLAWLGVSLPNEQSASGTVKADVVLGEDGLARAIRLVQE